MIMDSKFLKLNNKTTRSGNVARACQITFFKILIVNLKNIKKWRFLCVKLEIKIIESVNSVLSYNVVDKKGQLASTLVKQAVQNFLYTNG